MPAVAAPKAAGLGNVKQPAAPKATARPLKMSGVAFHRALYGNLRQRAVKRGPISLQRRALVNHDDERDEGIKMDRRGRLIAATKRRNGCDRTRFPNSQLILIGAHISPGTMMVLGEMTD